MVYTVIFGIIIATLSFVTPLTDGSVKFVTGIFLIILIGLNLLMLEMRKRAEMWRNEKDLLNAQELLEQRESQLDNIYNRPIWTLKKDIEDRIIDKTLPGPTLYTYIKDMTIACQEILSQGHGCTSEVRVTVYEYAASPLETDDGNDDTEENQEDSTLTLLYYHGRTSDKPREKFRMYKNNGEIDSYGKFTLDTLLHQEGKSRELFYPSLADKPIPGFHPEDFSTKRYKGFYSIPIVKENSKELIGMLSVDCTEERCLDNLSKPMMRHLAAMLSIGFLARDVNKINLSPPNFEELDLDS